MEQKHNFWPYASLCNGEGIIFWDALNYPERQVAGFFTREDLNRLLHL